MNQHQTDRENLKKKLNQYYVAKKQRETLRARWEKIETDFKSPVREIPTDSAHRGSRTDSSGTEGINVAKQEIKELLSRQDAEALSTFKDVAEMIERLPMGIERNIIEHRHLDCLSWKEICRLENITRTPCYKHYNKGLDLILQDSAKKKTKNN